MTPEFSRPIRIDSIGATPFETHIEASADERSALTGRFDLLAIDALAADLTLVRSGEQVKVSGSLDARVVQSCVASGEPVPADVSESFTVVFSPEPQTGGSDEEVELSESDCDVAFYAGGTVDVGEAVAETLSLSLDPWPRAPGADAVAQKAGVKSEEQAGPFAALAALKDQLKK